MKRQREQVRLSNLEILISEAGSAAKVAQLAGTSESYLSQVRRQMPTQKGTPRGLGDELAAKLEKGLGKPAGWMDEPHEALSDASSSQQIVHVGSHVIYTGEETVAVKLRGPEQPEKKRAPAHPSGRKQALSRISAESGEKIVTLCPLISWEKACASLDISETDEHRDAREILPCPVPCSQDTFILRVKGASMEPKFRNGDLIFVDPKIDADSGKYVVVKLEDSDEATFKQLIVEGGRKYLKALNPDWPERIIELDDTSQICGVVVFKGEMC